MEEKNHQLESKLNEMTIQNSRLIEALNVKEQEKGKSHSFDDRER